MNERKYYEAYEERYHQVHSRDLNWFMEKPSEIVGDVLRRYGIGKEEKLLELRTLITETKVKNTRLISDHMINLLQDLEGSLAEDKDAMVKKIDDYQRMVIMEDGLKIRIDDIYDIIMG